MIFESLRVGFFTTWQNRKIVLLFYFVLLVCGCLFILPFSSILYDVVGYSVMGGQITTEMNMDFLFEFLLNNDKSINMLFVLALTLACLYWCASIFLSGGAISTFIKREISTTAIFLKDSATYFYRFFRLWLWSIPVFILLYGVQVIEPVVVGIFFGKDPYESVLFWGDVIRVGLGFIGIMFYFLIFDYARIDIILKEENKTRKSLWRGIKFTFRNIFKTFSLSFLLFLFGGIILVLYIIVSGSFDTSGIFFIIILFIFQQLFILTRMFLRLVSYSSQVHLYDKLTQKPVPSPIVIQDELGFAS